MALVMNLKNDFKEDGYEWRINKLNLYNWFDFELNQDYPYYNVEAMATYRHQINTSPITISGISLSWGKPVINFSFNQGDNYDQELNARAYIPK